MSPSTDIAQSRLRHTRADTGEARSTSQPRGVASSRVQKYNPNPTVGPCTVSFTVRSLLATESVTFRYRML